ncbi:polysaccharide biosynthesis/export family protein [Flexithrix dorotheae]|uniref:polysaccharide biosynthesis/export family protein n=1 Tax=Flexithrix dorotheae TaxID=70993 RepID=UPI00039F3953|nr:polysaccharide biosynthesis/export family protein [Flexithrix dorotheae]
MRLTITLLLLLGFNLIGCVKYNKLLYMQDKTNQRAFTGYTTSNYTIKPFDNLSIKLNSFEQSTTGEFNSTGALGSRPGGVDNALLYLSGYMVNQEGFIRLPLVGDLKVVGLTTDEIKDLIDKQLEDYLKFPSVSVKLTNFRISVLGEVNRPGVQYIYEGKVTLLQALSQAGDLTDFANRKSIKLIRETGKESITSYIDVSKPDLISSEYYFLLPNDIIYVEPTKAKAANVNTRVNGLVLSVVSVVITTINLIVTINK